MNYKVSEIVDFMNDWAKPSYQESWDNSGSQILLNEKTDSVVISLDLTDEIINRAIEENSKLIITHHPMFFSGIKSIDENSYMGKNIIKAIKNNISIYSAHTSLDIAEDGVNDCLCKLLGLKDVRGLFKTEEGYYMGKVGQLEEMQYISLRELSEFLIDSLKYDGIKVYGKNREYIKRIAICGGSGASLIDDAIENNADVYITGDIKHHDAQYAYENELSIIDISHYHGEKLIIDQIAKKLKENFEISTIPVDINAFELSIENL